MEEIKDKVEVIHRIIDSKLVVVPTFGEVFKYKDHAYVLRAIVIANEAQGTPIGWWFNASLTLYEYDKDVNGPLLETYTFTLDEYLKFSETKLEDAIGFYINEVIFSEIANNFINKEFKPNTDKYYKETK